MSQVFYFCSQDLVGRFSSEPQEDCPLCLESMSESGWMQSAPEKGSEGSSEALTEEAGISGALKS